MTMQLMNIEINLGKRENLMGNTPHQSRMYQKKRKTFARKLCPSLQDDRANYGLFDE